MKAVKPTKSTPKQADPAASAGRAAKPVKAAIKPDSSQSPAKRAKPATKAAKLVKAAVKPDSSQSPAKRAKPATKAKPAGKTARAAAERTRPATKAKPAGKTTRAAVAVKSAAEPAVKAETASQPPAGPVLLPEPPSLNITGDPAADAELAANPFSLLTGMLLDQQFPMERAFAGPYVILQRLGADTLDPTTIAAYDPEEFVKLCQGPPAVHRYPGAMAARIQELARIVLDEYDGDATTIWATGTAKDVTQRLRALPGFGAAKAKIFLALLGKQFGIKPRGWVTETGPLGKAGSYRSVADVVDAESLLKVRATKQELKKRAKQEKAG
jgi:uncharacterized HhH-GPD family protein